MGRTSLISYLDTNVVIFLHAGDVGRISHRAAQQIDAADLLVSSMVLLEMEMLYEKGVLRHNASQIISDLNQQIGVSVCRLPMALVIHAALQLKWTREPGDRLIVANAIANNQAPLITSDNRIRTEYPNAVW